MALTETTYTGDGSDVTFGPIPFEYLKEADVKISLNGVSTSAFTIDPSTKYITFSSAPGNGVAIRVYRVTDDAALAATFISGSAIRATDLNDNFTQNLYVTQESNRDATSAVSTANTALSQSNTAIADSATAISDSATALSQSNTAISDSSTAVSTANTAISTANAASAAVAAAVFYTPVADLTALGALTPSNSDFFELQNSNGAESDPSITSLPGGFVGDSGITLRLRYDDPPGEYVFLGYFANDSETRYIKNDTGTVTSTNIADGTIVDADVNASAAIAGTKIDPDFGSQTVETTGVFSAAGGAAATPSITFTGDTNTGIYSPGADQVAISTGGTGRLFVDSSGRVGISTTNPSSLLEVLSSGSGAETIAEFGNSLIDGGLSIQTNGNLDWGFNARNSRNLTFSTNQLERARIDSSGRLLVGTSSGSYNLTVRKNLSNASNEKYFLIQTGNHVQVKRDFDTVADETLVAIDAGSAAPATQGAWEITVFGTGFKAGFSNDRQHYQKWYITRNPSGTFSITSAFSSGTSGMFTLTSSGNELRVRNAFSVVSAGNVVVDITGYQGHHSAVDETDWMSNVTMP